MRQAREAWKAERQPKMQTEPHRLADWGITSTRADFLAELRGFEPLTSAVEAARGGVPPLPRLIGQVRSWIRS